MKKLLFIVGLLFAIMQFTPRMDVNAGALQPVTHESEETVKSDAGEDMHHRIEAIGNDLKEINFLTPRRTVQPFSLTSQLRAVSEIVRNIQYVRIKGADRLQKISESVLRLQNINHSALLTRMGYRVYALREIII